MTKLQLPYIIPLNKEGHDLEFTVPTNLRTFPDQPDSDNLTYAIQSDAEDYTRIYIISGSNLRFIAPNSEGGSSRRDGNTNSYVLSWGGGGLPNLLRSNPIYTDLFFGNDDILDLHLVDKNLLEYMFSNYLVADHRRLLRRSTDGSEIILINFKEGDFSNDINSDTDSLFDSIEDLYPHIPSLESETLRRSIMQSIVDENNRRYFTILSSDGLSEAYTTYRSMINERELTINLEFKFTDTINLLDYNRTLNNGDLIEIIFELEGETFIRYFSYFDDRANPSPRYIYEDDFKILYENHNITLSSFKDEALIVSVNITNFS